jgi:WD40 repeat protein
VKNMKKISPCGLVVLLPIAFSMMSSQQSFVKSKWTAREIVTPPSLINCVAQWGSKIATGCRDGRVRVYDIDNKENQAAVMILGRHTSGVQKLAVMPDGKLVSISKRARMVLKLWNSSGECEKTTMSSREQYEQLGEDVVGFKGSVVSLIGCNKMCIVGIEMSTKAGITCWDPYAGKFLNTIGDISSVSALTMSPGGTTLVSGNQRGMIHMWDIAAKNNATPICLILGDRKITALWALTDKRLLIGYGNGVIKTSGGKTGEGLRKNALQGHKGPIRSLCSFSDDTTLLSASKKTIKVWDMQSHTCLESLHPFRKGSSIKNSEEFPRIKDEIQELAVVSNECFVSVDKRRFIVWRKVPCVAQESSGSGSVSSLDSSLLSSSSL